MAYGSKKGFLSSLFGKRKQTEQEDAAELESRHRLDERIQQILAERVEAPALLIIKENRAALKTPKEEIEAEVEVELFPISASVLNNRKAAVRGGFPPSGVEVA